MRKNRDKTKKNSFFNDNKNRSISFDNYKTDKKLPKNKDTNN